MRTAIVSGATGFIGVNLVENLVSKGYKVIAIARPASQRLNQIPSHTNVRIIEIDAARLDELPRYINHADEFFSLAWEGARGTSRLDDKLQQENFNSTMSAMKTAYELGVKVFVGCGSQAEYGSSTEILTELTKEMPDTAYGRAKYACGQEGERFARNHEMQFVWPRIFSIYGPGDFPGTLLASAISNMLHNKPIECSACTQKWDYLYVKDAADALAFLSQNGSGVYNVASGDIRELRSYLEDMKQLLHSKSELHFGPVAGVSIQPSVQKLLSLGWQPRFTFAKGIEQYAAHLQANA